MGVSLKKGALAAVTKTWEDASGDVGEWADLEPEIPDTEFETSLLKSRLPPLE